MEFTFRELNVNDLDNIITIQNMEKNSSFFHKGSIEDFKKHLETDQAFMVSVSCFLIYFC